jgi:hypothetical protein
VAWAAFYALAPYLQKNSTVSALTLYAELQPADVRRHGIAWQSAEEIEADREAALSDERLARVARSLFGDDVELEPAQQSPLETDED